jgi:hypothetical protein
MVHQGGGRKPRRHNALFLYAVLVAVLGTTLSGVAGLVPPRTNDTPHVLGVAYDLSGVVAEPADYKGPAGDQRPTRHQASASTDEGSAWLVPVFQAADEGFDPCRVGLCAASRSVAPRAPPA